ncbi:MAG: hypothetical protein JW836_10815, partial [Deltaproteobacteria bacterium]|nr:hypothetical protein [Deltaproteobacteria bacterium]
VEDWRSAVDEVFSSGMVRCEGKGDQARDLNRKGRCRLHPLSNQEMGLPLRKGAICNHPPIGRRD